MTKDNENQTEVLFTESPASWNTRYLSPEGFVCQLTLRDETGFRLLEKTQAALQDLLLKGCIPYPTNIARGTDIASIDPMAWCPVHNCEMRRWEKDDRVWFSHKINGEWCKGGKR